MKSKKTHQQLQVFWRVVILFLAASTLALAQASGGDSQIKAQSDGDASKFTVEQVMSAPFPSDLVVAKRGSRAAWIFNSKGERNIWVADGPDFVARQISRYRGDEGQPLASPVLSPDGHTIVYVRGSEVKEGGTAANPSSNGQDVKQQVWAIDIKGVGEASSEPRLLGEMGCSFEGCEDVAISPDGQWAVWSAKHVLWMAPLAGGKPTRQLHHLRGDSSDVQWSPDGKLIAFRIDRRDHSFIAVYDMADESVRYMAPTVDQDHFPRWKVDGKRIVFVRTAGQEAKLPLIPERPEPWSIWVADPTSGSASEIWHSGKSMNDSLPPFAGPSLKTTANGRVVFVSEHTGRNHLYSIPLAGGETTALTHGDFDVEDVVLGADQNSIIYSSNQYTSDPTDVERRHLWRVAANGGEPAQLSKGETIEWNPVETGDGKSVLCLGSAATLAPLPYRLTNGGRESIAKNVTSKDFPSDALVVPKQVIFKSEDGYTIHAQLFVPRGRKTRGPALIFTHGGPSRQMLLGFHYMYYYHNAYAENQYLANLGYVVLSVNYRLGIMYGRAFRRPPNSVWRGASEYRDVVAGARYLQSLPIVDTKKIGLWGGSYGGFLTALGLARNSDIFSAGVDFHGVHDWSSLLSRRNEDFDSAPDAKEAKQLAWDSSPDSAVATWRSPVLLIHGDDDRNVNFTQTTDLVQRLREHKVPFEQLIFPDDIHDFLLWRDWVNAYKATGRFFDEKLK